MDRKWYARNNQASHRSRRHRDICHRCQTLSAPCLSIKQWKFALGSWSLHNSLQPLTEALSTALRALLAIYLQQYTCRKACSKITVLTLTAGRLFSYLAQPLLCARSHFQKSHDGKRLGKSINKLVSLKRVHHPHAKCNSAVHELKDKLRGRKTNKQTKSVLSRIEALEKSKLSSPFFATGIQPWPQNNPIES